MSQDPQPTDSELIQAQECLLGRPVRSLPKPGSLDEHVYQILFQLVKLLIQIHSATWRGIKLNRAAAADPHARAIYLQGQLTVAALHQHRRDIEDLLVRLDALSQDRT